MRKANGDFFCTAGYSSFAVTSFAEGSQVMLRKNGQVGIGSDVTLKIVQH